jgi:hypothetical protein
MVKNKRAVFILMLMSVLIALPLMLTDYAFADKLSEAIAQAPVGTERGQIDPAG